MLLLTASLITLAFAAAWTSTEANDFTLTVLHSGNLQSRFDEIGKTGSVCSDEEQRASSCYGGVARLRFMIELWQNMDSSVSLYTGNIFRGTIWFSLLGPRVVADILNELQFDAIGLGIHEFYRGPEGLLEMYNALQPSVNIVACNANFSADSRLSAYSPKKSIVVQKQGYRIGLVGFTDPAVRYKSSPGPTLSFTDPLECVKNEARKLKKEGARVVIAFGTAGFEIDKEIAKAVPELAVLVSGAAREFLYPKGEKPPSIERSDGTYPLPIRRDDGSTAYVVTAYRYGKYLGVLNITFDKQLRPIAYKGRPRLMDKTVIEDLRMNERLEQWRAVIKKEGDGVVGSTKVFLVNNYDACSKSQCNGGTLLADAAFDFFSNFVAEGTWSLVNGAVINAGAAHIDIDERLNGGEIRKKDLYSLYPYEDKFVLVTMQGNTLYKMMEHSISGKRFGQSQFLQVAGLRVTFEKNRVKDLRTVCRSCRTVKFERVFRLQWYTIAMPQFISEGGDEYDFSAVPKSLRKPTNYTDIYVLTEYLKKHSPVKTAIDDRVIVLESGSATPSPCFSWFGVAAFVTAGYLRLARC